MEASFAHWVDDDSLLTMMAGVEDSQVKEAPLTPEQQRIVDLVREGKNVLFTGSGGTGKTLVLQRVLKFLRERYRGENDVVIAAPTGIAAIRIEGSTIHRAAGIGISRWRYSDLDEILKFRQGMTLDYVKVNLQNIFAPGQLYVALSGVRSTEGLQVNGDASRSYVMVCQKMEFYKALARKEAHLTAPLRFPDLVFDFPEAEVEELVRKYTRCIPGNPFRNAPGAPDAVFETVAENVFSEKNLFPVICYRCNTKGHPASVCKFRKVPRIN